MNSAEPIAFFITWTVYGTHLQGDARGWRKRRQGEQLPQPRLAAWRQERLKYGVELLTQQQRSVLDAEIERFCGVRGWHLWARNVRTNHVHVVVTATGYAGSKVRDQLKANCTRVLREGWPKFEARPVWTVGGDWECVNTEEDLEQLVIYVSEVQDRKGLPN